MLLKKERTLLLLTEQSYLSQKALNESLESEGYRVELVQNTYMVWEKLETKSIILMIIDDEVSSLVENIFNIRRLNTQVPIIMMINPKKNLHVHDLLRKGSIKHCILKPFSPESLAMLATNVINKNLKRSNKIENNGQNDFSFPGKSGSLPVRGPKSHPN